MKNSFLIIEFLLSIMLILFTESCKKDIAKIPVVNTLDVSFIESYSARLGGNIISDGNEYISERGFCWNTSENPTIENNFTNLDVDSATFYYFLTTLEPNTLYYVRAYAINSKGIAYGNEVHFTTIKGIPRVISKSVAAVTSSGAECNGQVLDNGGSSILEMGIYWGIDPSNLNFKSEIPANNAFNICLVGLLRNTKYFIRAYAKNSEGIGYGDTISFKTLPSLPVLATTSITSITGTSANSGGFISDNGGIDIVSRGVCWNTSGSPTIADNRSEDGIGIGSFKSNVTGLSANSSYYLRAYATNSVGTNYGDSFKFTAKDSPIIFNNNLTYGTVTDVDGNVYKTIKIGKLTWMAENLRATKYSNGVEIPIVTNFSGWSSNEPAFCWYNFDSDPINTSTYGALYNFTALHYRFWDDYNICPTGWHIPSYWDWEFLLIDYSASKLIENGNTHWLETYDPDGLLYASTNETGFTALPGGGINNVNRIFEGMNKLGLFWAGTVDHVDMTSYVEMTKKYKKIVQIQTNYKEAFSIRCIK